MTDSLFNDNNDPIVDPNKNYFDELVGEGKKFKTPEDLARSKAEADAYIQTIIRQKDEMTNDIKKLREEYQARASLEELIDQLKGQSDRHDDNPAVDDKEPSLDLTKIDSLVAQKIEDHQREQRERSNFNQVQAKLVEQFGNSYSTVLKQKRDELGLTEEDVNTLARRSPTAFFNTFGLNQRQQAETFEAPLQTQRRTDQFAPKTEKRTWSWYQKLKTENPNLYRDPRTQVQMHKDYASLGKDFEDGDFAVR